MRWIKIKKIANIHVFSLLTRLYKSQGDFYQGVVASKQTNHWDFSLFFGDPLKTSLLPNCLFKATGSTKVPPDCLLFPVAQQLMHNGWEKPSPRARGCSSRSTNSHTSLFLFILHADSTSSASLSICHSLLTASLLSLMLPSSTNGDSCCHLDIDVFIVNWTRWMRTVVVVDSAFSCVCSPPAP